MDFLKLARERYSVRRFSDKPLAENDVEAILQAGLLAPTACNNQPQKILVIRSEEALAALRRCTHCHFDAPCAMLVCYDKTRSWKREFDEKDSGDIDASIVATHMMLMAASLGVGSTWVMYFIPEAVQKEFKLTDNMEATALLIMGYPAEDATPSPKHSQYRPMEDTVRYL